MDETNFQAPALQFTLPYQWWGWLLWVIGTLVSIIGIYLAFAGTMEDTFFGWFIAGLETEYGQITYHLPDEDWIHCTGVKVLDNAPNFDGHTSDDVILRIEQLLDSI